MPHENLLQIFTPNAPCRHGANLVKPVFVTDFWKILPHELDSHEFSSKCPMKKMPHQNFPCLHGAFEKNAPCRHGAFKKCPMKKFYRLFTTIHGALKKTPHADMGHFKIAPCRHGKRPMPAWGVFFSWG